MAHSTNIIVQIKSFIEKHTLIPPGSTIIVGLSGGPDSVFLLSMLNNFAQEYSLTLIAAHLDHQWRKDSAKDAQFCKSLAERLKIRFVSGKAQDINLTKKCSSKEEEGRLLRRVFFEQVMNEYNADLIALAHHKQDQQENFFIRLIRGTTLTGLVGMRPKTGIYIRPLLETNKADIIDYLERNKISYLVDPTNIQETFLRNCIRAKAIPALQHCDKRFDANFFRTLHSLQEAEEFLEMLTNEVVQELSIEKKNILYIDYATLLTLPNYMQNRVIIQWLIQAQVPFELSEALLNEIKRFFTNKKSKQHVLYQSWVIVKEKNYVCINGLN